MNCVRKVHAHKDKLSIKIKASKLPSYHQWMQVESTEKTCLESFKSPAGSFDISYYNAHRFSWGLNN